MLHDCGVGSIDGLSDLDGLRQAVSTGGAVRYRGMLVSGLYETWRAAGLRPGNGDDTFRIDGIKAWADGANQAGTGYQREPYLSTASRGALNHSSEELAEIVGRAHRNGWQVGVHANGDAAIDVTLDVFERALARDPGGDPRHRVEHCSVLRPDQIERMVALGVSPSFLIGHIHWWGGALRDRLLGPERAAHCDPCASALRAGLRISLHSFAFEANPNINPAVVHTPATSDWVKRGQPLCLIGDSGTGKSHLLIALATEAAMAGYRVKYTLATKLVNELVEAADEMVSSKTIARYGRVDLICIDELGYMGLDRRGAELLFQVLTEREEKNSVAIASNEAFGGWTKTFTDPRLCAAIVASPMAGTSAKPALTPTASPTARPTPAPLAQAMPPEATIAAETTRPERSARRRFRRRGSAVSSRPERSPRDGHYSTGHYWSCTA